MHWEPGAAPTAAQWRELDDHLASGFSADVMFWEAEPLAATAAALAERGVRSLVLDPCGGAPASGDFASVMAANVAALEDAFGRD